MSYHTSKSPERSVSIQNLQKEFDQVHDKIMLFQTKSNLNNDEKIELDTLQMRKSELLSNQRHQFDFKHRGQHIRARAKWIKYGDIPSKYFLSYGECPKKCGFFDLKARGRKAESFEIKESTLFEGIL